MLEERPKIITTISNYFVAYAKPIVVIVVLALAFQGWRMYQQHVTNQETQLQQENAAIKVKIDAMTKQYNDLAASKKAIEADNVKLDADAQNWKKKANAHVVPPEPGPAPADDAITVADLKTAGVEFRPLTETPITNYVTNRTSLPIIWTWNRQALRVPELVASEADWKISSAKFETLSLGYKKDVDKSNEMLVIAQGKETQYIKLEGNFNDQLKQKDESIWEAKVNGWIKVGIAVPVVYGVTRLTHK